MSALHKAFPPDNPDRFASALSFLDASDRDQWVDMAFCTRDGLGEAGKDVWMDWSRSAGDKFNLADAEAVWKSAKAGGKMKAATLFYRARHEGWYDDSKPVEIDPAELKRREEERRRLEAEAAAEQEEIHAVAATKAKEIWFAGSPDINGHRYHLIKTCEGKRELSFGKNVRRAAWPQNGWDDALLVPIYGPDSKIISLEAISPNGEKMALKGGAKSGGIYPLAPFSAHESGVVIVAEGLATAAACMQSTGYPAVVAFCDSNLRKAAEFVKAKRQDARIVIAADIGSEDKARAAAAAVNGVVAIPTGIHDMARGADFWDVWAVDEYGHILVRHIIDAALKAGPVVAEAEPADELAGAVDATGANAGAQTQAGRGHRKAAPKQEKSAEFGEPIDLFGVSMPPQVPLSTLPASIAAYAKDQSALLGSDHSIVAMTALVAAAACVTDGIKLQPKRMDPTWTESARLWVGVVGDPSTKKSPSISKAVRHVKRLEARLAEKNAAAYGDWKARHEEWKEDKKALKGKNVPQEPASPPMKRLIVEDTTVEALGVVLNDNDRGVLCLQDELTGWFASMDAYKGGGSSGANKDRAHWLEAYNGGPRSIDRIHRQSISIPNWSVCMIGGIQPDMMRRIANGMGNDGLLQRFMILVARPSQKGEDRFPDRTAMDQFAALFDHLEALEPAEESVTMSEAAHQARDRIEVFADKMIRAFDHPHMQAWLGKWEGLFARLVLLYHVIECAEESIYPTTKKVTSETAEKVERLMCGTLLHHAIHFYQEVVDAHDRQSNMRQLARLILARGMSVVTKRDIHLYWRASRKLQQWEVKAVIDGLCNLDWLTPDETSLDVVDGKPKTWFVNPAVHTAFADHAERERTRREEAVEALRELKRAYAEA